jgi:hypothetical protein
VRKKLTGKELLDSLNKMSEEELRYDIAVVLCDTCYPIGDGDYDNAYYDYDIIDHCSVHKNKIEIFGYK